MKLFYSLFVLPVVSAAAIANDQLPDRQKELPAVEKESHNKYLKPRDLSTIANTEFGAQVKQGYSLHY